MCEKPDFERAQNTATKLLLQQHLDSLFVDVRTFTFDRRIHIDSVQNYARIVHRPLSDFICDKFSGCCVIPYQRCNLVLYDDQEPNEYRKHWGIVHEIGHVYLAHDEDGEKEEKEANFFTAQVVSPEIVLCDICRRKGSLSEEDLLAHFNVSGEAAAKRVATLNRRYCYNNSEIDQMLLAKFSPILDQELSGRSRQRQVYGTPLDWGALIYAD